MNRGIYLKLEGEHKCVSCSSELVLKWGAYFCTFCQREYWIDDYTKCLYYRKFIGDEEK